MNDASSDLFIVTCIPLSRRNTTYGGNDVHPPTLTPTERLRVIRACYQIWILAVCGNGVTAGAIARSFRPRELGYCAIMSQWGPVREFSAQSFDQAFKTTYNSSCGTGSALGNLGVISPELNALVTDHLIYDDLNQLGIIIWDHWQDRLKRVICGTVQGFRDLYINNDLWDNEPGDELFIDC
jgi:hypothetical protein